MIKICRANLSLKEDSSAVLSLLNEYAKDKMGGGVELSDYAKNNLVKELKKRENAHIFLGYVDTKPAGLIICFEGFSTFACKPILNIHDLFVHPDFRGQGISSKLLAKAEEVGQNLGCCKLTLEVLEGNKLAQKVYKKFGFNGYELDPELGCAMFYEKKLNQPNNEC